jgi:hypothetical protein
VYTSRVRRDSHLGRGGARRDAPEPSDEVFILTSKLDNFRLHELNESDENHDDDDDEADNDLPKNAVPSSGEIKSQAEKLIIRHTKPKRRKNKISHEDVDNGSRDAGGD